MKTTNNNPVGNSAAMCEALEEMILWMKRIMHSAWFMDANFRDTTDCMRVLNKADAALAVLPRNCDRFATSDEAWLEFKKTTQNAYFDTMGLCRFATWLFATAEEEEAE